MRGPPIVEEMRPAAPGRITARLKVNVIRMSNASKITPQYRRGAIEGRAELTAFPRTQDIGSPLIAGRWLFTSRREVEKV